MPAHFADSPKTEAVYKTLSVCQPSPAPETIAKLYRPASKVDKTHIHTRYQQTLLNESPYCECKTFILHSFFIQMAGFITFTHAAGDTGER